MYDPTVGEFIEEDPIGFDAQDANLYRYCENGPTNATDPSGLAPNVVAKKEITMTVISTGHPEDLDKTDFNIIDKAPNGPFGPGASTSMGWNDTYTGKLKTLAQQRNISNIVEVKQNQRIPVLNLNPPPNQKPPAPRPLGYFFPDYGLYHWEYTNNIIGKPANEYIVGAQFAITFQYKAPLFGNYKISLTEHQLLETGTPALPALGKTPAQIRALVTKLKALPPHFPLRAQVPQQVPAPNKPNTAPQFGRAVNGKTEVVFTDMPDIQQIVGTARRQVNLQEFTITGPLGGITQFTVMFYLEMDPRGTPTFEILLAE